MEDNRTSIKKRLDDIFIEKMGYLVNRLTNDQRSKSLLSDSAGMQARDLLKLYMELENEFHIDFNPLVLDGNFDKYDCLLGYIVRKTGKKIHIYVIDDGILNRKTNLIYALRF